MSRVLHFQADRIEHVLASHRVPSRVTGGTVTPRLVRFHLVTPLGVKVRKVASLSEEIALSLGAKTCRIYRQEGQVQVEVPRDDAEVVHFLALCRKLARGAGGREMVPPVTAVLGLDEDGAPLLLRLPSPNVAHVLIAGTTGSGKTALARTMVASLALFNNQRALQLVVVDPKGRGFVAFGAEVGRRPGRIGRPGAGWRAGDGAAADAADAARAGGGHPSGGLHPEAGSGGDRGVGEEQLSGTAGGQRSQS
jgi:DNA segregation ATPase FtsK/SpoIIIE-like protein